MRGWQIRGWGETREARGGTDVCLFAATALQVLRPSFQYCQGVSSNPGHLFLSQRSAGAARWQPWGEKVLGSTGSNEAACLGPGASIHITWVY